VNRSILENVIRNIFKYTTNSRDFELITYAVLILCLLIIIISLTLPKFVLIVFTILFLICCASAVIFHFNANQTSWALWILDRFTELFFDQPGDFIKNYFRSDKISLALSLITSLKLLSICGAICSLTLVCLAAMDTTLPLMTAANRLTPSTVQPIVPPPVMTITQTPIVSVLETTTPIPTLPLTNTEVSSSKLNQPPTPTQIQVTKVFSSKLNQPPTPQQVIKPLNNIVTPEPTPTQIQVTEETYQELLNTILPKIVIVDIKNLSRINNDQDEYVVIANYGNGVNMSNWYLSDMQGKIYKFEDFRLSRASVVRLHTSEGTNTGFDLYWGRDNPIWTTEEPHLFLFDDSGVIIDKW